MKTILRILAILLIATLISTGVYLIVQKTALASEATGAPNFDQASATVSGESTQPPARPEGGTDRDSASLERGLTEVSASLAKLAGIILIVLLIQTVIARLPRRRKVRSIVG